jgi:hypothetical protein
MSQARILVVSFLLGVSAAPNCMDRWGSTPLDDALRGGTPRHMFCAKLIAGWAYDALSMVCVMSIHDHDVTCRQHATEAAVQEYLFSHGLGKHHLMYLVLRCCLTHFGQTITLMCVFCCFSMHADDDHNRWGGRLGTLKGTPEGERLMQELENVDIEDVRSLIKRLMARSELVKICSE